MARRIYLSPPHMSGRELELIRDAIESNWVAPLGPHVDAFERELVEALQRLTGIDAGARTPERGDGMCAVALSSGTAALHLALRIAVSNDGHRPTTETRGNEILCPTFTFSATVNVIFYEGAIPVFIDSDAASWNIDPDILRDELRILARRGRLPRAVIAVDLYGQCADYDPIVRACAEFDVPLIEDAAEALGAVYWGRDRATARGEALDLASGSPSVLTSTAALTADARRVRPAGCFGAAAAFSFNGNKILTTSGGGMLVAHDQAFAEEARFLATQARDPAPHYQHSKIGFNYRMSNILAAIGRAQLAALPHRIAARRRNFEFYRNVLGSLPGVDFMPEAGFGRGTRWLTCLTFDPKQFGANREDVRLALEAENIEARPVWKPMHLQPVFETCRVRGGAVAERLFANGLCLPSGSVLTEQDLERICTVVKSTKRRPIFHYVAPWSSRMASRPPRTAVAGSPRSPAAVEPVPVE